MTDLIFFITIPQINKSLILILTFTILFLGIYHYIGKYVLTPLFISDECYYHSHQAPWYIELLFDFPSSESYHPVLSNLWYFVFGAIGFYISKLLTKAYVIKTEV